MTDIPEKNIAANDVFEDEFGQVDMQAEQRTHDRHGIETEGQLKLSNGFKIPFRVIDMSRSGARIALKQFVILPNDFQVEIFSPDRRKLKTAKVSRQWQRQNECGVKFLSTRTELMPEGSY